MPVEVFNELLLLDDKPGKRDYREEDGSVVIIEIPGPQHEATVVAVNNLIWGAVGDALDGGGAGGWFLQPPFDLACFEIKRRVN